ncbi:MAG: protein-lysine N-methyltransferase [Gemmatimonadetes bacterium]|nr:protein-lysine N-methyltransferase [Gemmatimonadota bacterium]
MEMSPSSTRDFARVGKSRIQGRGVFAKRKIPRGTRIFEYEGKRLRRDAVAGEVVLGLTSSRYVLAVDDDDVIDGEQGGNDARFVNHGCEPSCEVYVFDGIPYVYAMRDIMRHEELTIDYKLRPLDGTILTHEEKLEKHPCQCGSTHCRGTLIA